MARLAQIVEHDVRELSTKAIPVMENLEVITEKVKNITETIDEQVFMMAGGDTRPPIKRGALAWGIWVIREMSMVDLLAHEHRLHAILCR